MEVDRGEGDRMEVGRIEDKMEMEIVIPTINKSMLILKFSLFLKTTINNYGKTDMRIPKLKPYYLRTTQLGRET